MRAGLPAASPVPHAPRGARAPRGPAIHEPAGPEAELARARAALVEAEAQWRAANSSINDVGLLVKQHLGWEASEMNNITPQKIKQSSKALKIETGAADDELHARHYCVFSDSSLEILAVMILVLGGMCLLDPLPHWPRGGGRKDDE